MPATRQILSFPIGTRVVLTQDSRNPYTGHVSMEAGHVGTVTREANKMNEDPSSEVVILWDGGSRPVRTMCRAIAKA